jgi:AraC-like DNA-binding protein
MNDGHSLTTIQLQTFAAKPRFFAAAFNRRKVMAMDAFSQALSSVRMTGAIFVDAICTAPWGFSVPAMATVTHLLAPGTEHLVGYHLVTEGEALIGLPGVPDVPIAAGDIVIFPHGDAHTVANGAPTHFADSGKALGQWLAGDFVPLKVGAGGGGAVTRFVCGYFGCERHAARLFLAGLPACIRMNLRGDGTGEWLETSIRHLLNDTTSNRPGRGVLLAKMAEAIFIETLRRYMEELPPEQTGWLAGARDPVVGAILALFHRKPCHPWSVAELASEAATSRTVLLERFDRFLGEPPLTYLARWRLQLAARKLQTTQETVLNVAADVGYESEAAFNRAFKREFGLPPARYRKNLMDHGKQTLAQRMVSRIARRGSPAGA